jgi:putative Mn2+ efflux pump MntP
MDAFAVALCKGLKMRRLNFKHAAIIAFFFGFFQALMPLIGWALGINFEEYITSFNHWIAFILLSLIGGKMIWESMKKEEDCECCKVELLDIKELLVMAVATSIDALAVGVSFAFLRVSILPSIAVIGLITLMISYVGVVIGNGLGSKLKSKAELAGGVILIAIGMKILFDHLGVL